MAKKSLVLIAIFKKIKALKKLTATVVFLFLICKVSLCQYWQQEANYTIGVRLNEIDHSLDAAETIEYKNNSADTLTFLWIHLWPNAYKNDRTAYSEQQLRNGNSTFYFSKDADKGFIENLAFTVNEKMVRVEPHPTQQDIVKLLLNIPLAPAEKVVLKTPFRVQLPKIFSRSGYLGQSYQIAQWFPKIAVYDKEGWHPMPYLDQGEFYADFGQYDVSITVPKDFVVAATGNLASATAEDSTMTYRYLENNIHDFAWFADEAFTKHIDRVEIDDTQIQLEYYAISEHMIAATVLAHMKDALVSKSKLLGSYPYKTLKLVEDVTKKTSGMEYPTITVLYAKKEEELESIIYHEVGHNWLQGILATNERKHPWMDEGMNSFYDKKYKAQKHQNAHTTKPENKLSGKLSKDDLSWAIKTLETKNIDQPISTAAENFNALNYQLIAYEKTALWLERLELTMGNENFEKGMRSYFYEWKFKHPGPDDFKRSMQEQSEINLDEVFSLIKKTEPIQKDKTTVKLNFLFNLNQQQKTNYISVSPILGGNFYDKLMIGGIVHNYNLPPSKLQFLVAPLYSTGTSSLTGLYRLNYTTQPFHDARQLIISTNGSRFTGDNFTDSTGKINAQPFTKITAGIKYIFGNRDLKKNKRSWLEFKSYDITETTLSFTRDPVSNIINISYPKEKYRLQQLSLGTENNRVLYPYHAILKTDFGKSFARMALTINQYFNYSSSGGLNLRIFAGKFIYTGIRTSTVQFATDRFHLNMSGPKGNEDYEYSNYFYGRNEFEGFAARQIMERDGFFKVKTDFLSNKIGKDDNWLGAINLSSTIPNQINPLSILPIKIPIKLFFDVGTNASLWNEDGSSGKFLYDGGFQLSIFKDVLNIYFPLVYSKVYGNYFKSTIPGNTFKNNISFSINFKNLEFNKIFPGFNL